MIDRTAECEERVGVWCKPRKAYYAVLAAVCALVIGVYAWSAKPGWLELWSLKADNSYYNQLVQGFEAGQLNLRREVPSEMEQPGF